MTQIEMDVARSAFRKNKAVAEYFESQNEIRNCIDWEQRRYEIAKEMMPVIYKVSRQIILRGGEVQYNDVPKAAVEFAEMLIEELQKDLTK